MTPRIGDASHDDARTGSAGTATRTHNGCDRLHRRTAGAVLESAGVRLRCLARRPAALASRVSQTTEVVAGDLLDPASLDRALAGIDVAYYLVHSMGAHGDYRETDRIAARNFGEAARRAGVRRIVHLGGLATGDEAFSTEMHGHLRRSVDVIDERKVLGRLNRRLNEKGVDAMTTAVLATYYPPRRRLTVSYAGHPTGWLFRADTAVQGTPELTSVARDARERMVRGRRVACEALSVSVYGSACGRRRP